MRTLIILAVAVLALPAGAASYKVRAAGLNCNFCAYTIERHLGRIEGVDKKSIDIDVPTGVIIVASTKGAFVDPVKLRDAITKGGYTYKGMEASIDGTFVDQEGKLAFQPEGSAAPIPLIEPPQEAKAGLKVNVHAMVELGVKSKPGLKVMHFKPAS
jgi:copper chaperone CopZ